MADPKWPFQWILVGEDGAVRVRSAASRHLDLSDSTRLAGWTALAVLDIGDGFVQSLHDDGASNRVIVVYDRTGRPIDVNQLSGAPALLACDRSRRQLLGVRFTSAGRGRGELTAYDY